MTLHEKQKLYMMCELGIRNPTEKQIISFLDDAMNYYDSVEELEIALDEWGVWGYFDYVNNISYTKYTINHLSNMNPSLCIAALQELTHVEDGLYIHIDATENKFRVKIEDEYVGLIGINDGLIEANGLENLDLLYEAKAHLKDVFKGIWV